jgi:hexosaminidase
LIRYAAARGVTLVPEIEMPGHSLAALACFPELSCTGGPFEIFPYSQWPADAVVGEFCAGNEATFTFLTNVLTEVIALFPSRYVHIGGDEVPKNRWKTCAKCQARMKAEGLKDELELQSYFIRRLDKFVKAQGRAIIGWDEILEGGLAPNAAVMSWRGVSGGIAAARAGHPVVMAPTSHCYFDYPYSAIDTLRAYSYEPVPPELDATQAKLIQGLQANFWSHIDREPDQVDSQLFPRLLGIAERGWSPKDTRDPKDFSRRVTAQLANLERFGVHYRPEGSPFWTPAQVTEEFRPLEWDITALIRRAGNYEVTFTYKSGAHRLAMRSVELLAGGKVVATDQHLGVAGGVHSGNIYTLNIPPSAPGTVYTLRAEVRSEGGTDSSGEIQIRLKR